MRKWFRWTTNLKERKKLLTERIYWKHKNSNLNAREPYGCFARLFLSQLIRIGLHFSFVSMQSKLSNNILEWIDELPSSPFTRPFFFLNRKWSYSFFVCLHGHGGTSENTFLDAIADKIEQMIYWPARVSQSGIILISLICLAKVNDARLSTISNAVNSFVSCVVMHRRASCKIQLWRLILWKYF